MPSVPRRTFPLNMSLTPRVNACSICGLFGGGTMWVKTSVSTLPRLRWLPLRADWCDRS